MITTTPRTTDALKERMVRLAKVSAAALGLLTLLAWRSTSQPFLAVVVALGWVSMPLTLLGVARRGWLRWLLLVPCTAVTLGVLGICLNLLLAPLDNGSQVGWWLLLAGIVLGDLLGAWFWLDLLPVPRALLEPTSPGRWVLIAIHVTPILLGFTLVTWWRLIVPLTWGFAGST